MKYARLFTILIFVLITAFFIFFFCFCFKKQSDKSYYTENQKILSFNYILDSIKKRNGYYINTAVLFYKSSDNYTYDSAIEYLKQPVTLGVNVSSVDVSQTLPELDKFDILYLDESISKIGKNTRLWEKIIYFVEHGGNVVIANNLYEFFPKSFIGVKDYIKIEEVPIHIVIDDVKDDYKQIRELISDFSVLYKDFSTRDFLIKQDYGMAVIPDKALVLARNKGNAIYTVNNYGEGRVFYINPLLPNKFSKSSFSLNEAKFKQGPFSNTTATFNQLFYSYIVSYAAKQKYGFSLNRVFGSYGSPIMSWSLHYENIPGIKDNGLKKFSELAKEYNQIPSYSIVRNVLNWITRTETASYIINDSKNKKNLSYKMNLYENPFGAGTYIACNDKWIQLNTRENAPSGVTADIKNKVLFYPFFIDYDKDGLIDMFAGSSDGKIYYFKGLGFRGKDGRLVMSGPKILNISVDAFSSPQLLDIDGDGVLDIITGSNDGNIYYFKGLGNLNFDKKELLLKTDIQGISLPAVGDINSDGIQDIIVGSDTGVLLFFYGEKNGKYTKYSHKRINSISRHCADWELGKYLSPYIVDYNKDGVQDIIIGTQDGYVARLKGDKKQKYLFDGYIKTNEMNILGNYNLKFGLFSNPRLLDLNNDGKLDIVAGYEDVDLPYPIDSEYFPYRKELAEQIKYAKDRKYYIGMHFFSGGYASKEREEYEIKAHLKALKKYGVTGRIGVNQHGGPITRLSEIDSYKLLYRYGILWESFFESREHAFANWMAAETAVVNPFFVVDKGKKKILIQNIQSAVPCTGSRLPCGNKNMDKITSKYDAPVLNYSHPDDMNYEMSFELVNDLERYRKKYEYNFVKENQMMEAIAAAYNLKVMVREKDGQLEIIPKAENHDFPLYNGNYQNATGIKIEFSSALNDKINTNALVYRIKDKNLYVGLNNNILLYPNKNEEEVPHLIRVNIPAKIQSTENGIFLDYLDDGLMQASVNAKAYTKNIGWQTEYDGKITTFTKFGEKDKLHIIFGEEE